jgi:hypothetical protein
MQIIVFVKYELVNTANEPGRDIESSIGILMLAEKREIAFSMASFLAKCPYHFSFAFQCLEYGIFLPL